MRTSSLSSLSPTTKELLKKRKKDKRFQKQKNKRGLTSSSCVGFAPFDIDHILSFLFTL
jgi:hypothetical protein